MKYTMPKAPVVTKDICPECFGDAACTHGGLTDHGTFVHDVECDECGESYAALVMYDCPDCTKAVKS